MSQLARSADHPITSRAEDLLDRAGLAALLADEVQSLNASQGAVVGVLGDWGSGKTSLVNMIVEQLEDSSIPVVEFNPWLFSGTEQLVTAFFEELAAQLRPKGDRLGSIAEKLEMYGDSLSPLRFIPMLGPWLDRAGSAGAALGRMLGKRAKERGSVSALRQSLAEELAELDRPMVVIVDDLDRLRSEEVREIFKLIRLTGNFPNVVYLVAFDRRQVESALGDEGIDGRAYLEKILQIAYEVPPVPQESLRRLFLEGLQGVVDPIETGPFNETLWPDVFVECVWPYVGNLRDAKRYLASLPLTLRHIGDHVALVDVMAVEALRVFAPEAYRLLPATAEALTQPSDVGYGAQTDSGYQSEVEAFVRAAGENDVAVRSLCKRVFPASERYLGGSNYGSDWLPQWRREQRIAHPDLLGFYIDRTLTQGMLASRQAERAFAVLNDEGALRLIFADLSPDEIESTIAALEAYEPDYPPEAVEPACRVLIDLMPGLRTESRGMFDFGAELVVRRVVLRLLRRLDSSQVLGVTRNLFESIDTLHGRFELVTIVGHRENAGHKLISQEEARILEDRLREEIAGASAQDLADERDLLKLLWWCMHPEDGPAPSVRAMDSPQLQEAVMRASLTEARSQAMGSRAVHREKRLAWDVLVKTLGGEGVVQAVVERLQDVQLDAALREVVELADRYLSGWRPDDD